MWRPPSRTPSCSVRAELPAHSQPMEQSNWSRCCASLPGAPGAVAVLWARGEGGAAAVQVAAQLAVANRLKLVISPAGGRRAGLAAKLTRDGIAASDGPPPAGAIVVAAGADSSGDPHLAVLAGTREGSDKLGPVDPGARWEQTHRAALTETRPPGQGIAGHRSAKVLGSAIVGRAEPVPFGGPGKNTR